MTAKRAAKLTVEQLLRLAGENGVSEIAEYLWSLRDCFLSPETTGIGWMCKRKVGDRVLTLFSVNPTVKSGPGQVNVNVNRECLGLLSGKSGDEVQTFLEQLAKHVGKLANRGGGWKNWTEISLSSLDQTKRFVAELGRFAGISFPDSGC
jgi:hypothetical protein